MRPKTSLSVVLVAVVLIGSAAAQDTELYVPRNIAKAYEKGTRSTDGAPGPQYWQNRANYSMDIDFNPQSRLLKGVAEIDYMNHSPDTLNKIYIHLLPNFFKKGYVRDFAIAAADENDGITIDRIKFGNSEIEDPANRQTMMRLDLESPITPGDTANLSIAWHYTVSAGSGYGYRTGGMDSTTYFIAYFFPHIAVYDDIDGWDVSFFTGRAEFYNEFGNFDVRISVPKDFVVWATGLLQKPETVLRKKYADRLQAAMTSDEIIHIINAEEARKKNITQPNDKNIWQFKAENVPDFAFAISDHYLWDASSLIVDQETGRRVLIDAAYDETADDFFEVAEISRKSVEYMSYEFPAAPFPFPQITVFNGSDEMEYPMMVNDWSMNHPEVAGVPNPHNYSVHLTAHEIFHSYFPFYMGINETKYAWMDEGWATFGDFLIGNKLNGGDPYSKAWGNQHYLYENLYNTHMGSVADLPLISTSSYIGQPTYGINSYAKAALFYMTLQDVLGAELFKKTVHTYVDRWNGKHPTPFDFFYTLNDASGMDLNWLINPWFFELGYPDLAIAGASQNNQTYSITIEKLGSYPVPIQLQLFYEDGSVETVSKTAAVWKSGETVYTVSGSASKSIERIELGDIIIPDANPENNHFDLISE